MSSPCCMCDCESPLTPLLGNGSVNKFPSPGQRTHTQQQNCWTWCFLDGPCSIRYSIRSEKKVADQFFPDLLVYNTASCLCFPTSHKMKRHVNIHLKQEVLGRTIRILCFDTTRTAHKTKKKKNRDTQTACCLATMGGIHCNCSTTLRYPYIKPTAHSL
jgi:hypothetical protein